MRRLKLLHVSVFVLVATTGCYGERSENPSVPAQETAAPDGGGASFDSLMSVARAEGWADLPIGEIVQRVGLHFVGSPYEAGLLDRPDEETLVVSFGTFDCVLLVETALAAARGIRDEDFSYNGFLDRLQSLRYRGGDMRGYCSRLHYFSEWIHDNEQRTAVRNITADLGGVPLQKTLSFMTSHRDSYPKLVASDSLLEGIKEMEASLVDLPLFYIPQDRISDVYDDLRSGDIIATATSVGGLDVSHTGLVYRDGDAVHFLHASPSGGVKVSPDLQDYVQNVGIQIGIVVARPL